MNAGAVIMRGMRVLRRMTVCAAAIAVATSAPGLELDLTSGNWRPASVFVEYFEGESLQDGRISSVVGNDLRNSGYFRPRYRVGSSHGEVSSAHYAEVRDRGGEYLLTGRVHQEVSGGSRLFFELHDALTETSLGSFSINFTETSKRTAAHKVSNWVFESIARLPGVFHTKVAYIVREENGTNLLRVADYDGHNAHTVLTSPSPLISPSWSPNGNELVYVSFETRQPVIYHQSLLTGERTVIANFPGTNSAPAMSPNGREVAMALTRGGDEQKVYVKGEGGELRKISHLGGIATEPTWAPDGERMAFVSDASGAPQIYEQYVAGGAARRVTFGSKYCVSPSYSRDGEQILHICRDDAGRSNIAIIDLKSGESAGLTDIREADSPSFSANGAMVIFKNENISNALQIVAVNGIIISQWEVRESGEVINPVWGPAFSDWF